MRQMLCLVLLVLAPLTAFAESGGEIALEAEAPREIPTGIGIDLQYLPVQFPRYVWTENRTTNETGHGFHLGLEWIPFDERYGKLGFGVGTGVSVIKNVTFDSQRATVTAVPVELTVSYRFDYVHHQLLVPFVKAAGGSTFVRQRGIERADWMTFRGISYGGGLELCISSIDSFSSSYLKRNTGIHSSYFVAEFLHSDFLGERRGPDLVRDEWRLGLRFEI